MFGLVILFDLITFLILPLVVLAFALTLRKAEKASTYGTLPLSMGMVEAWSNVFKKSMNFSGRASRSEFWWFFSIYATGSILSIFIFHLFEQPSTRLFLWLFWLPVVAVGTRRLHDIGRGGVWQVFILWGTGAFGLLILWALPTKRDA